MEKKDIHVGKRYTDNRGAVRLVVSLDGDFPAPAKRGRRVSYRLLVKRRGNQPINSLNETDLGDFAKWAKRVCP